ncbi:MAG: MFS transporter [Pseudomonadota bacterium]
MNDVVESQNTPSRGKLDPNSMVSRTFLAFLATAGLFYVNIMPAIVDGLVKAIDFTTEEAGFVASANVYGAAAGALLIVFLVSRLAWRPASYAMLAVLIATDLLSTLVTAPEAMIAIRFVHGFVGGALVGIGFAVIARTLHPDKTFGVLLVVQFGLGGVGNLYLPRLVPAFGVEILFYSLIAFSLITIAMLPFLDDYAPEKRDQNEIRESDESIRWAPLVLTLLALFTFQAGNMGLFAFIIGLGESFALDREFITWTLAASGWIGIVGAAIVVVLHTTYGRFIPLTGAIILTVLGILVLHNSDNRTIFLLANCAMGITWAFVIPYLLGLCSEFDSAGRMAALGGFASKMGLASGPLVAGLLLVDDNYGLLINVGAATVLVSLFACALPAIAQDRRAVKVPTAG